MLFRSPSPALPAGFIEPCLPTLARTVPYRSGRRADWVKVKNPAAPAATRVIER